MNPKEQGQDSEKIFSAESASEVIRQVYGASAAIFAKQIRENLLAGGVYSLADLGSHKGDFISELINNVSEYSFSVVAIDVNEDDLSVNPSERKILSDLSRIDMGDKSVDVSIMRYALAWNIYEKQREVLSEVKRITKKIAVIQHQGADSLDPAKLQNAASKLFDGRVSDLKREGFYFSTSGEVEEMMGDLDIKYVKVDERRISGLSTLLALKYNLSDEDQKRVVEILGGCDYVVSTTWVLKFEE